MSRERLHPIDHEIGSADVELSLAGDELLRAARLDGGEREAHHAFDLAFVSLRCGDVEREPAHARGIAVGDYPLGHRDARHSCAIEREGGTTYETRCGRGLGGLDMGRYFRDRD